MRYLDKQSDAAVPPDHVIATLETEFLEHAFGSNVVVRGEKLCAWAALFWDGRGFPYRMLQSPIQKLRAYSPEIAESDARQLLARIPGAEQVILNAQNFRAILEGLFPCDLWRSPPSLRHGANWLIWLDKQTPPHFFYPLFKTQAALWQSQAEEKVKQLYGIICPEDAREFLNKWLGIDENSEIASGLPEFPLDIPEHFRRHAAEVWKIRTVEKRGVYFRDVVSRAIPFALKEDAVRIGCEYFRYHGSELQDAILKEMAEFLPFEDVAALREIVPPTEPPMPPEDPNCAVDWVLRAYLPYRLWAIGREEETVKDLCRKLGTAFSLWYISFYPSALSSGDDAISFRRCGRRMCERSEKVTLLIILDGIGLWDAQELERLIRAEQRRLTLTKTSWCFSALPTVTSICKPAMRQGVAPANVNAGTYALGEDSVRLLENEDAAEVLKDAKPGNKYIWSVVQTDKTYHQQADYRTIQDYIRGVLATFAKRLAAAVVAVPNALKLDVIITTDHGRFLGSSKRTLPVPVGMSSHQRTAWGSVSGSDLITDFQIVANGKAARLHPERYGLAQPTLVAIDEDSFLNNDGSGGLDWFPHGGAWPEEVVIPWLEFQRDTELPNVEGRISGSSVEGREGDLEIYIVNGSPLELDIISLSIAGDIVVHDLPINQKLPPNDAKVIKRTLSVWPSASRVSGLRVECTLRQPTGDHISVVLENQLQSESFQKRHELLDDLL